MSDYNFTNDEFHLMGDYLLAELAARENGPISESFAKTCIAKQNILTESYDIINENAKMTRYEYHNYGVTVTRDQFEKVYTNPDTYRSPFEILHALSFPQEVLQRNEDSLRKIVGAGQSPRNTSLIGWYNNNSSPAHRLVPLSGRKKEYSHAAKIAKVHGEDGDTYTPTSKQIDAGKKNVKNRTSKVVDNINDQEIFGGEFYNNLSRIPRKNWNHWLKFWDRRLGAVEPNKKKALGNLIGRTWGKTFLLGYSVDQNIKYEIWYNSLDSSFSVYDMHGVEMGSPSPTLQEAIRDLIHVVAQASSSDKANFGVGKTGSELAASLQRTLGNVMSQDVGVMRREHDLRVKELARQSKEDKDERKKYAQEKNKDFKDARAQRKEDEFQRKQRQQRKDVAASIISDIRNATQRKKDSTTPSGKEYWDERLRTLKSKLRGETEKNDPDAEYRAERNKAEKDSVRQYDIKRAVRSGQGVLDTLQRDEAVRAIELELANRTNEIDRMQRELQAALNNAETSEPEDLEPISPEYIEPGAIGIYPDGTFNPEYQKLVKELQRQLAKEHERINTLQKFRNDVAKGKKRGLGNMEWMHPGSKHSIKKLLGESFEDIFLDDEPDNKVESNIAEIDDRQKTREVAQIKKQAEASAYNKSLLISDVTGSLKTYDETKIKKGSMAATVGNWVRDTIAPTRLKAKQSIKPGFWSRIGMFFRGQTFRADFVIGWTFADRLNLEIWYVTEQDPSNPGRLISSFWVYDVNAKMVIRKYIPYYRIAISTVSAKLGVVDNGSNGNGQ